MNFIGSIQVVLFFVFYLVIFALAAWALVDCLTRPAAAFTSAGKRTRTFWIWVLVAATVVSFLSIPIPGVYLGFPSFLALLAAAAAIVYLVDVRPAVAPYSRRRGGGRGPQRGGW
ncbi:DUF2516 family protein [Cellulomonas oligotrophica]|uniref:DUF2516 domain-containing protein n=1 Tax=Cellulomonas oligotrophica TaxID=931536 RepID=A0A7Y9JWU7_9CELL|nr:DUF2516 family protein [Cellulomonas oligotrophica]NYD86028.1 hypothetical protein [Cellulomonas oligotrophica]GIG30964.1 hypothetical protein Col01nite_01230 [Cellulomonas oligotrophica]